MAHRSGQKFSSSHTTLTEIASLVVDLALKIPGVKKVAIGEIKAEKTKPRIQIVEIETGFKIIVTGHSVQTLYLFVEDGIQITPEHFKHKTTKNIPITKSVRLLNPNLKTKNPKK